MVLVTSFCNNGRLCYTKRKIRCKNSLTDIHEILKIAAYYKSAVDVLQIRILCRQTDLIRAAVKTGKIVNIKKGQFLAPSDVKGILSKTDGATEVWITERGTSFGYGRLINDSHWYVRSMTWCLGFVYDITPFRYKDRRQRIPCVAVICKYGGGGGGGPWD